MIQSYIIHIYRKICRKSQVILLIDLFLFSQKLHKWNGQWSLTNDPKMYHEQRLYIIFNKLFCTFSSYNIFLSYIKYLIGVLNMSQLPLISDYIVVIKFGVVLKLNLNLNFNTYTDCFKNIPIEGLLLRVQNRKLDGFCKQRSLLDETGTMK